MSIMPAIYFEPDGYVLDGPKLMGRQAAGNGFLRAAIDAVEWAGSEEKPAELWCYTANQRSAEVFAQVVRGQAAHVNPLWLSTNRLDLLAHKRALFLPGPGLGAEARRRLRAGVGAWSLTGTTYTLCSHNAMDAIVDIISAPVMPWDALICATTVAKKVVQNLFEVQAQYLAWRFGAKSFIVPELPIIPFGVHQKDFEFTDQERLKAREQFQLESEDIAILFSGRLSFHAKAHPYPMFKALEDCAENSGKKITLLLCGQFPNDAVKKAFIDGARNYAPDISVIWVNGKEFNLYSQAWAAADIFVSLSDNLQETFGITPVEAMASGLPVIVSDWDGYKDTIVEGETGFRVPTWMPLPGVGVGLASEHEAGTINYDQYIGYAALDVSVDNYILKDRLYELIISPDLRRSMGEKGRARVAAHYDWAVVMIQYQELWGELDKKRVRLISENPAFISQAPDCAPERQDPYRIFAGFSTHIITPETRVKLGPETWRACDLTMLWDDPLFSFAKNILPSPEATERLISMVSAGQDSPVTISRIARGLGINEATSIKMVSQLAKVGVLSLVNL